MFLLSTSSVYGEDLATITIDTSQSVIYCDVLSNSDDHLSVALNEGSLMTYRWDIRIEEVRDYWLNKDVGSVQFSRLVVPDLMLHQWTLKDSSSGIVQTTLSSATAATFLSRLQHFPVIDKSLLQSGVRYFVRVRLYVEEGAVSDSQWSNFLKLGKTVATVEFTLP